MISEEQTALEEKIKQEQELKDQSTSRKEGYITEKKLPRKSSSTIFYELLLLFIILSVNLYIGFELYTAFNGSVAVLDSIQLAQEDQITLPYLDKEGITTLQEDQENKKDFSSGSSDQYFNYWNDFSNKSVSFNVYLEE